MRLTITFQPPTHPFVIEKQDFSILNLWHDSISLIDIIILYLNADTLSYIKENMFCENMKEEVAPEHGFHCSYL